MAVRNGQGEVYVSLEDIIYIPGWGEECYVCGIGLGSGNRDVRFEWQDEMVVLCSMKCTAAFEQSPIFYVTRRKTRRLLHGDRSERKVAA